MLPTITNDEVLKVLGINLNFELLDNDNASEKVIRFINEVNEWCYDYLRRKYALNDKVVDLPEWRQNYYKQGVIRQIEYVLRNGNTSVDNGYIRETGLLIDLSGIDMGRDAYAKFYLGAFCNIRRERDCGGFYHAS